MSEITPLPVQSRDQAGKGAARATRRAGLVPGVIYGDKQPPVLISMDPRPLIAEMKKTGFGTKIYELELGKDKVKAMAHDVQMHPVTDAPEHVDFLRVSEKTVVHVNVPVIFENDEECPGLKRGGVLNIVRHDVEVVAPAMSLPESLNISLKGLDIGDSIHISAVDLPKGVRPSITDRDFTIATIAAPTVDLSKTEGEEGEEGDEDGEDKAED